MAKSIYITNPVAAIVAVVRSSASRPQDGADGVRLL